MNTATPRRARVVYFSRTYVGEPARDFAVWRKAISVGTRAANLQRFRARIMDTAELWYEQFQNGRAGIWMFSRVIGAWSGGSKALIIAGAPTLNAVRFVVLEERGTVFENIRDVVGSLSVRDCIFRWEPSTKPTKQPTNQKGA